MVGWISTNDGYIFHNMLLWSFEPPGDKSTDYLWGDIIHDLMYALSATIIT